MSIAYNDLHTRPWTKLNASTADNAVAAPIRIMAVNINHTATATVILANAVAASGATDIITVRTAANDSRYVSFGPNGVKFGTGLSVTLSAGVAEIYYVAE